MKKLLSLFTAILFVGGLMADDFHLVQVKSVEKGKTYAFVRNGKALVKPSSSALQTEDISMATIDGTQAYLWKLYEATGGFKLQNLSKPKTTGEDPKDIFLRNTSSTSLSLSENDGNNVWKIEFTGDVATISIDETSRFLGETEENSNQYKAYAMKDFESRAHDFLVYECVAGAATNPVIEAHDIELGNIFAKTTADTKVEETIDLEIKGYALSEVITAKASDETKLVLSGDLTKEGGTLSVKVIAPASENGTDFNETITLKSGETELVVKVTAKAYTIKEAVYKKTALAEIGEYDEVIVTMTNAEGTYALGSAASGKNPIALAVSPESDQITVKSNDSIFFTLKQHADSFMLYKADDPAKWLGYTKTNGLRVATNKNHWLIIKDAYISLRDTALYIGVYKSKDWRAEKEIGEGSEITGQTLAFYVKKGEAPKSNDASIKSLKINGAAIAAKKNIYEYAVAADENIAEVEVVYELNHAGAKADKASPFKMAVPASSEDAATELKLTVTAEDNTTTAEYTIKVSRAQAAPKSSDATIQELKINNQVVEEKNGNFAYVVPADENIAEVEVAFILNEVHAQADKENPFKLTVPESAEDPASVATINVTAQDGVTKKEYTVSVTRASAQGLNEINTDNKATKRIENGVLIIEKSGVRFNAFGQRIQ